MGYGKDGNDCPSVVDLVNDPAFPDANTPKVSLVRQLHHAGRAGIQGKGRHFPDNPALRVDRQLPQPPIHRRLQRSIGGY